MNYSNHLEVDFNATERPEIAVLCGSTRFVQEFKEANQGFTMQDINNRYEAATEGPWEAGRDNSGGGWSAYVGMVSLEDDIALNVLNDEDAEFIAHARTDVPALVAALEAVIEDCQNTLNIPTSTDQRIWESQLQASHTIDLINQHLTIGETK